MRSNSSSLHVDATAKVAVPMPSFAEDRPLFAAKGEAGTTGSDTIMLFTNLDQRQSVTWGHRAIVQTRGLVSLAAKLGQNTDSTNAMVKSAIARIEARLAATEATTKKLQAHLADVRGKHLIDSSRTEDRAFDAPVLLTPRAATASATCSPPVSLFQSNECRQRVHAKVALHTGDGAISRRPRL